jgi:hypothetical protein
VTRFYTILFLSSSAVAAVAFWLFFGRTLHYIVGYGDEGGWTEEFATSTRICLTAAVALLLGALITWLVCAYRHDYRSRTGRVIVFSIVLLGVVWFFRKDAGTWYVRSRLSAASTPEDELEAYRLNNHRAHSLAYGYSVTVQDRDGVEFRPWISGDYERVAFVRITWENGTTVGKPLLNRKSLSYIFGE